ncbi:MAG: hypothetical protein R8K49_08065 [Mariprofundaceae bacterium]
MIRNIIITLIFFFGPALLMLLLRQFLFAWRIRQKIKKQHPDVIDITPSEQPASPSRFFIISAMAVGCIFAYLVWNQLSSSSDNTKQHYAPAHINAQGELIPESYQTKP